MFLSIKIAVYISRSHIHISSESVDMLVCHLQPNVACNYAYTSVIFRCEISEIKQIQVHAITIIIHQNMISVLLYIDAKHLNKKQINNY